MEHTIPDKTNPRTRFLELLSDQVGRGIYVWSGNGELLDQADDPID